MKIRTFYHYTSWAHVEHIVKLGYIETTESNLSMTREHAGPDVVWLTNLPEVVNAAAMGLNQVGDIPAPPEYNKTRIRIAVTLPSIAVKPWITWAQRRGIKPEWYRALTKGRKPKTWFVIERRIALSEVLAIHDMYTGAQIWPTQPAPDYPRTTDEEN